LEVTPKKKDLYSFNCMEKYTKSNEEEEEIYSTFPPVTPLRITEDDRKELVVALTRIKEFMNLREDKDENIMRQLSGKFSILSFKLWLVALGILEQNLEGIVRAISESQLLFQFKNGNAVESRFILNINSKRR
jgi:hypothetical protein